MHPNLRYRSALSFVITLWFLIASLGYSQTAPAPKVGSKVAVVVSTLQNPWFVVLANTVGERAKELGYEVTLFDSHDDLSQESAAFDTIIGAHYSAILLNVTDSKGSIANVMRAKAVGIPVFCMDRLITSSDAATSQIISDNYSGCALLGEYFVSQMGDKAQYIELLGQASDTNTWMRSKAFHSVVDNHPGLKMVAQEPADFDRAKAREVLAVLLTSHPDAGAVFCCNDAMAMGAYDALLAAGKADKVKVFGFDGDENVVKAVAEGKITATVMQYPKKIARTAAEYADKYLKGDRSIPQRASVAVDLITKATAKKF